MKASPGNFIFLGSEKWESGNKTSKHHLVRQMIGRGARVLYIENISMRRMGSAGKSDVTKAFRKITSFAKGVRSPLPNLYCLTPLYAPFPKSRMARAFNSVFVPALIRFHAWRLNIRNPVYFYFMPTGVLLQDRLGEALSVYYIVDNYAAFADVEQDEMRRMESEALKAADLVFATSQTLVDARKPMRPDVHFSPHGVDFPHFSSARNEKLPLPADLISIASPRIGFMGGLAHDSVDFELIERLAKAKPSWNIILFGRAVSDISSLLAVPNIYYLGIKSYEELPNYLKALDVAIIPFLVNELTQDLNPLKLREYLAAGLPTVATNLPAMQEYRAHLKCALTDDEWIEAISSFLQDAGDRDARQRSVETESWDARVDSILEKVENALGNPS